ncbi:transmembrane protein 170A [Manacus vitellinus]|uniref:transmembrane protein 170A n=1 Tax=Manacus vitellinus TaxID=328815 RepID=UPI00084709DE|nr:transmembrane protein 170A [Manacus vitellinus]
MNALALFPPYPASVCHVHILAFRLPTGAAFAGVYRAAGKKMIPFEALIFGVGQTFCVVVVSFLRILATL